jgi:hypothetical protein
MVVEPVVPLVVEPLVPFELDVLPIEPLEVELPEVVELLRVVLLLEPFERLEVVPFELVRPVEPLFMLVVPFIPVELPDELVPVEFVPVELPVEPVVVEPVVVFDAMLVVAGVDVLA